MSSKKFETHDRVLQSTLEILESPGGHSLSMEMVATRAGVSRQALYLHFRNRSELLLAAAAHGIAGFNLPERKTRVFAEAHLEGLIEAFAKMATDYLTFSLKPALAIVAACREDEELAKAWAGRSENRYKTCRLLVERILSEKPLAHPWSKEAAIDWLWSLTSHLFFDQLVNQRGWSLDRFRSHLALSIRSLAGLPASGEVGREPLPQG